jgi:capsular polysaccharide transport system permease protein
VHRAGNDHDRAASGSMKPSTLTTLFKSDAAREVARLRDPNLPVRGGAGHRHRQRVDRIWRRLRAQWAFLLVVVLPTLIASIYYFLIASNQYVSEARFMVRGQSSAPSLIGQVLAMSTGSQPAEPELLSLTDYLKSHDAVRQLDERLQVVDMFRRPESDWFSRVEAEPTAESLLDYYNNMISVSFDSLSNDAVLRVRAFRPEDAQRIADTLLNLGEELVNRFSERQRADTLEVARSEVERAEKRVMQARENLTAFRDREKSIDPGRSSVLVMELISKLEGQLAQARAEMLEASAYLKPDNAKYVMLRNKAEAIEGQIATEKKRLTGGDGALAPVVAQYERLLLTREFADKGYASSLVSLEAARVEALKQHMYLVRVVEPNRAEKALYPRRLVLLATILVGSLMFYGIGWLIIAGIREHAG